MDKWDRKTNFNCDSCMYYVPKKDALIGGIVVDTVYGRCRRHAPTMKGFPVVWASDWCGEHKIGSNPARDASGKCDHAAAPREDYVHWCEECKKFYAIQFQSCPECGNNGIPVREPAKKQPPDDTGTRNAKIIRFCRSCEQYWDTNAKVVVKPDIGLRPVPFLFCPKCVASGPPIAIVMTPQEIQDRADAQSRG